MSNATREMDTEQLSHSNTASTATLPALQHCSPLLAALERDASLFPYWWRRSPSACSEACTPEDVDTPAEYDTLPSHEGMDSKQVEGTPGAGDDTASSYGSCNPFGGGTLCPDEDALGSRLRVGDAFPVGCVMEP